MAYRILLFRLFYLHCFADGIYLGKNLETLVGAGGLKSRKLGATVGTTCLFENLSTTKTFSFAWVSFDGVELTNSDNVLDPGKRTSIKTFTGHTFAFRNSNGKLLTVFEVPQGPKTCEVLVNQDTEQLACLPGFVNLKEQRNSVAEVDKLFLGTDYRLENQNLDAAFEEFQRLANEGNSYAVHRIGETYLFNKELPLSARIAKAVPKLREAAMNQISDSWVDLAIIYLSGFYLKKDWGVANEARFLAICAGKENLPKAALLRAYSTFEGWYVGKTGLEEGSVCREAFAIYNTTVNSLKRSIVSKRIVSLRHLSMMQERETPYDMSKEEWQALVKRAEEGDHIAGFEVGQSYMFGEHGAPQDYELAVKYFEPASRNGNGGASRHLGFLYWKGFGVKSASAQRGFQSYILAVKQGDIDAHETLSWMYENGIGTRMNINKAIHHSKIAASHGQMEGQYQMAKFYEKGLGKLEVNKEKAKEYYMLAAAQDHIDAQHAVAVLLMEASVNQPGPDEHCLEALNWMKRAAEQWPEVQIELETATRHFQQGDITQAFWSFLKMSILGYSLAQLNLGWLIEQDSSNCDICRLNEDAYHYYNLAAKQNESEGLRAVGDFYFYGKSPVEASFGQAYDFYSRSLKVDPENPIANFDLGFMTEHGLGTKKDFEKSKTLYELAIKEESDVTSAAKYSLWLLSLRSSMGWDLLGSFCDTMPTFCKKWSERSSLTSFGRSFAMEWSLLLDWDVISEFLVTVLFAFLLTWWIPGIGYRDGLEVVMGPKIPARQAPSSPSIVVSKKAKGISAVSKTWYGFDNKQVEKDHDKGSSRSRRKRDDKKKTTKLM